MNVLEKYRPVYAPDGAQSGATGSPDNATASTPSGAPSTPTPSSPASSSPPSGEGGGSPGGGTKTPSAAPPAGGDSASGDDYFSAIFGGGDSAPISPPPSPAATTPAAASGTQPPAAAKPAAAEPTAPPAAPPAQTPAATTGEKPAAASPQPATPAAPAAERQIDRYDPGALSQHLRQNEAAAIQYVAENVFRLTPEEAEGLETDVMGTVPKLLAKAFVMSQQNVLTQLASIVPTMIQRQNEAMKRHGENEGKFYAAWPSIKQSEHGAIVTKYAAVYRQMHPEASLEQMIQDVGPMVMMAARIPATPPTTQTGLTPAQTPVGASALRPPQPSPFVPGSTGGPVSNGQTVEPEPWEAVFNQG